MPTKILYQTYSGGSGYGDPKMEIGIVKEAPIEVLKQTYKYHYIHRYMMLYRPIVNVYPCNVKGLIIENTDDEPTISLGQALLHKYMEQASHNHFFTKNDYVNSLQEIKHKQLKNTPSVSSTYEQQVKEKEHFEKAQRQLNEVAFVTIGINDFSTDSFQLSVDYEMDAKMWKSRFERAKEQRNDAWKRIKELEDTLKNIQKLANISF